MELIPSPLPIPINSAPLQSSIELSSIVLIWMPSGKEYFPGQKVVVVVMVRLFVGVVQTLHS